MTYSQVQEMLDRMQERMSALLVSDPSWEDQASAVAEALSEAGIPVDATYSSPQAFCRELFRENDLSQLAKAAISLKLNPEEMTSPIDLIQNVLVN